MKIRATPFEGMLVFEPDIFHDERGFFLETYRFERYQRHGVDASFVQDNLSLSNRGVLRGLHYQHPRSQGKLVYVLSGEVFEVAVDIRVGSPTFGKWFGVTLSWENKLQLFIPENFAHGFVALSETALLAYKCTDYYLPRVEGTIRFDDPDIAIQWPCPAPALSEKDRKAPFLSQIALKNLPTYDQQGRKS